VCIGHQVLQSCACVSVIAVLSALDAGGVKRGVSLVNTYHCVSLLNRKKYIGVRGRFGVWKDGGGSIVPIGQFIKFGKIG
jgi:hypothetical protein